MSWLQQLFWCVTLTIIWFICKSETSLPNVINVDHFLEIESAMISKVKNYLSQERERLKLLKVYLKVWKKWRKIYTNEGSDYLAVPQNIFHLFKRLTMDLGQFEDTMKKNSFNDTMMPDDIKPPTDGHLKKVVLSLIDLQYLYDLKPNEIMNGTLMGDQFNTSLSLDSCYFIGKTCLEFNEHSGAVDWLNTCHLLSANDDERRKQVYNLLYPSYIFLKNKDKAYSYASNYLNEEPYDIPARDAILDIGFQLEKLNNYDKGHMETYRLCRGEFKAESEATQSTLKCRYKHDGSAFLKIAPLKEEELHDDPKILLYREVLYDSEIERMKAWAATNLKVATVVGRDGKGGHKAFNYRVSETAFMDNQSPEFSSLSRRIEDMSELSISTGEMWQFLGYTPGGHYTMHSDYLPNNAPDVKTYGNRVASMLFYFNEVIFGGETVFTNIRVSVKPVKGSAIIWYNIHPDGSQNNKLDHSACPVVIGEKWGFTQWFRSNDQISLRRIFEKNSPKTAALYQKRK
ncbi:prolyl 4-hydroxylase subunit alpha-2-like [Planococcus citri]|uniref:prolyl 4-hydroxylase subunit alpha-2-like n=1 Tax=Planococcus citri TaxID=170843 RepID=UPI0031F7EFDD